MDRFRYWSDFVNGHAIRAVTEIGVWRGEFAEHLITNCPSIERYYLVDPWRHLSSWNKPFNKDETTFADVFDEVQRRIAPFSDKCIILRGTTTEVELPQVDFTYIDGDHTLRGISIDLIRAWPKTTWLGGDDYGSIWQHGSRFEPSMVFPFAAYFAEAVGASFEVCGNQYLLQRNGEFKHEEDTSLLPYLRPRSLLKRLVAKT